MGNGPRKDLVRFVTGVAIKFSFVFFVYTTMYQGLSSEPITKEGKDLLCNVAKKLLLARKKSPDPQNLYLFQLHSFMRCLLTDVCLNHLVIL